MNTDCDTLTEVYIPTSVRQIGSGAFASSGLTSVIIPDSVTFMGQVCSSKCFAEYFNFTFLFQYAFYGCELLTYLALPNSLKEIPPFSFAYNYELSWVSIPTYCLLYNYH